MSLGKQHLFGYTYLTVQYTYTPRFPYSQPWFLYRNSEYDESMATWFTRVPLSILCLYDRNLRNGTLFKGTPKSFRNIQRYFEVYRRLLKKGDQGELELDKELNPRNNILFDMCFRSFWRLESDQCGDAEAQ